MEPFMIVRLIDTHIHVWDFGQAEYTWLEGDTSVLNRTYALDELENERKRVGVTGGILVQAANNLEDTSWMLAVAGKHDWIRGVVGWLPLQKPEQMASLLETSQYAPGSLLKG